MLYNVPMLEESLQKIYRSFIRWYSMPESEREEGVKSFDEFCIRYNIDKATISDFQDVETFTEDYYSASIAWGKSKVPEMLHTLYEKFKKSKDKKDFDMFQQILNAESRKKEESKTSRAGLIRELFNRTQAL